MTLDARQFDMFATLAPVAPRPRGAAPAINNHRPGDPNDHRRYVACSAWDGWVMVCGKDDPDPIEVTVRGIRTVISFGFGIGTHAVEAPGTPYWSETGFRSFTGINAGPEHAAEIVAAIERFIDAPAKDGNGCGGKLREWWPLSVLTLRDRRQYIVDHPDAYPKRQDQWEREESARVRELGYDPDVVAPWPKRRTRSR